MVGRYKPEYLLYNQHYNKEKVTSTISLISSKLFSAYKCPEILDHFHKTCN